MTEGKAGWRDALNTARQKMDEFAVSDPRARKALDGAKSGAEAAGRTLDSTRRKVTQEEAFADVMNLLEEVVDVLVVQAKVIDGLTERVAVLESTSGAGARG